MDPKIKEEAREMMEKGVSKLLEGFDLLYGINTTKDPNFIDTPKRVAKSFMEMTKGTNSNEAREILKSKFPSTYSGMVTEVDIPCFSVCPHHLLPVRYKVSFAYIPNEFCLGLSKIPRIVKLMAQSPMLQEDFTQKVITEFNKYVEPKGAIIYVEGWHMCMGARGVEMPMVSTITSELIGAFKEPAVKNEFYQILLKGN